MNTVKTSVPCIRFYLATHHNPPTYTHTYTVRKSKQILAYVPPHRLVHTSRGCHGVECTSQEFKLNATTPHAHCDRNVYIVSRLRRAPALCWYHRHRFQFKLNSALFQLGGRSRSVASRMCSKHTLF